MQMSASPQDLISLLKQGTENYQGSVTLMKQLTVAVVSAIVYFKDAFPEDSYNKENFRDINLRILKMKCRDESAQFLSTALIHAFDAFDKRYLHRLALCFYNDECKPENLIDYHIFEYTYHKEGASISFHSGSRVGAQDPYGIVEKTYSMLQSCIVINNTLQKKLPASFDISLRLYYNEDAPEDYQAPGFQSGVEFEEHLTPADMSTYELGDLRTRYLGLRINSHFNDNLGSSHEAIASQNPPLMTQTEDLTATWSSDGSAPAALRCPCGIDRTDLPHDVTKLITCNYCKKQQHAACFGLLQSSDRHCCTFCSDEDRTRSPTCPKLAALSNKKRECHCALRLALSWCAARGAVGAAQLRALGLAPRHVDKLLFYLRTKAVLSHDDWNRSQKVNEMRLRDLMKSSFLDLEERNFVDRLLEETLASQESQHDPVGEVLSPMEMASLREDAGVGRAVRTGPTPVDSALLKQYRDALTPSEKDEDETPLAATFDKIVLGRKKRKLEPDTTTLRSKVNSKRARGQFE